MKLSSWGSGTSPSAKCLLCAGPCRPRSFLWHTACYCPMCVDFQNLGPSLCIGNCLREIRIWPEHPPGSSSPSRASASYCLSRESVCPETWGSPGLSSREHPDLVGQLHPTTEPPWNRAGWYCAGLSGTADVGPDSGGQSRKHPWDPMVGAALPQTPCLAREGVGFVSVCLL